MAEECIICGCSGLKLAQCKDISSWTTLYRAAVIRNHKLILEASTESEFPERTIKYHRNCQAELTNKRDMHTNKPYDDAATGTSLSQTERFCLINACFAKSQSTSQTRRPEKSFNVCGNFAPTTETVRENASLHVKQNTQ